MIIITKFKNVFLKKKKKFSFSQKKIQFTKAPENTNV